MARSMAMALSPFRYGNADPTTWLAPHEFVRATFTPEGPGTLRIRWRTGVLDATAWGDGAGWLLNRVPAYTGADDIAVDLPDVYPVVTRAARDHPGFRIGASGGLYHELLPTIAELDLYDLMGAVAPHLERRERTRLAAGNITDQLFVRSNRAAVSGNHHVVGAQAGVFGRRIRRDVLDQRAAVRPDVQRAALSRCQSRFRRACLACVD